MAALDNIKEGSENMTKNAACKGFNLSFIYGLHHPNFLIKIDAQHMIERSRTLGEKRHFVLARRRMGVTFSFASHDKNGALKM
ncbi:hypothetical protein [Herminiimonas arsenitoxidans]|uniref:hypothetical protein n=1 Tax=Herminiimonas arsenitoxidans TaxID=1809410 RepID=UPI0013900006|nr:hypothetical protein [Herminiimonas arsenitoxidans]